MKYSSIATELIDFNADQPRKDAKIWRHGNCEQAPHPRDENLRLIRKHGRAKWKRLVNYHRRSLAETHYVSFQNDLLS